MDFVESCRRFIAIDSTSSQGSREIGTYAANLCKEKGLEVETQTEIYMDHLQVNVMARPIARRPHSEFMLLTHLDTHEPGNYALWKNNNQNPFDAQIIDKRIYGLGSSDAKLDFLCKLEAILSFPANSNWKLIPVLVGTFGKELGMVGTLKLIRKNKVSPKYALIGEPTNLHFGVAAPGLATVEIRIPFAADEISYREEHNLRESTSSQSRIFHAKTEDETSNALIKMLTALLEHSKDYAIMEIDGGVNTHSPSAHAFMDLDQYAGLQDPMIEKIRKIYGAIQSLEKKFSGFKNDQYLPQTPTLNIGIIRTTNSEITIQGTCQIPPSINNQIYEGWMEELRQVCSSVRAEFKVNDYKKPYSLDEKSILLRGAKEEHAAQSIAIPFTNESSLWARLNVECFSFGAGTKDPRTLTSENVSIEDLHKAIEFYKKMIARFCL